MPKVSVLMPAYNAELYIGESIESILNQTFVDFELIIVDDCSGDNTWNIIQNFAKLDKRIIAVKNDINLNIAGNRNKLLSLAKGEYICWQDADDISFFDRIEKQVKFMDNHPNVGICGGYIEFFENKDTTKRRVRKYHLEDNKLRSMIFQQSPVSQGTAIVRKRAMDKIGNFDNSIKQAEDLDISFRIGIYYEFANIDSIVLHCRYHSDSISTKQIKNNISDTLKVRKRYKKNSKYSRGFKDEMANIVTYLVQFLPAKLILKIFEFIRG